MEKLRKKHFMKLLTLQEEQADLASKTICIYLAHCRQEKGISRAKLATIGKFGEKNMRRIECGAADPRLSTLLRAIIHLNIPLEQFFNDALTKGVLLIQEKTNADSYEESVAAK